MKVNMLGIIFAAIFISCAHGHEFSNDEQDIDSLYLNASIACSHGQPLTVNQSMGFIQSPFRIGNLLPRNLTCSWLLLGQPGKLFWFKYEAMAISAHGDYGFKFYDGRNDNCTVVEHITDQSSEGGEFRSPSNELLVKFVNDPRGGAMSFQLFFEEVTPTIHCDNSTSITCRNGYECALLDWVCDGESDCDDGTDEENCTKIPDQWNFKECGKPAIQPDEFHDDFRIVGGKAAEPGSWPWLVDLRVRSDEPFGHTCGASILNRLWLLSAAHCFMGGHDKSDWRAVSGKYHTLFHNLHEVVRYVEEIKIHPHFNYSSPDHSYDLALIKLNAPLPLINPWISSVCLPRLDEQLEINRMVYVTGWGSTEGTGNEWVLKQTKVPIVSPEKCSRWDQENITSSQICAGFEQGGQDSCKGDSGGPLVDEDKQTGRFKIYGVVSHGGGDCGGVKEAGVYSKVSTFVNWINQVINYH